MVEQQKGFVLGVDNWNQEQDLLPWKRMA